MNVHLGQPTYLENKMQPHANLGIRLRVLLQNPRIIEIESDLQVERESPRGLRWSSWQCFQILV